MKQPFLRVFSTLAAAAACAAAAPLKNRFGGPFKAADLFPSRVQEAHPLNPALLAEVERPELEFGLHQDEGRSLSLALPNAVLSIASENREDPGAGGDQGPATVFGKVEYELGYGLSLRDLGLSGREADAAAWNASWGFQVRYLALEGYESGSEIGGDREEATGDFGMAASRGPWRADLVVLNALPLLEEGEADFLHLNREANLGLTFRQPGNWQVTGRLGLRDDEERLRIVDLGAEKIFFDDLTFRVGSRRFYSGEQSREISNMLMGGLWVRLNRIGKGYRYPATDRELFHPRTALRLLHGVQAGLAIALETTRAPGENGSDDHRTGLLFNLGKSF